MEQTNYDIHSAVAAGAVEEVESLLQADPNLVNVRDDEGNTPLHIAVIHGWAEIARSLMDKGARVNARNNGERRPLDMAIESGHNDIAEYLRQKGGQTSSGDSPTGSMPSFDKGRHYRGLGIIAAVFEVIGWLVIAAGFVIGLIAGLNYMNFSEGFAVFVSSLVSGILSGMFLLAFAYIIRLLMDIEANTRSTRGNR